MENGPFRVVLISIREIVLMPPVASATLVDDVASIYIYIYMYIRGEKIFLKIYQNWPMISSSYTVALGLFR